MFNLYARLFGSPETVIRQYSTNNVAMSASATDAFHPRLKTVFQQLDLLAPRFVVGPGDVEILLSPEQFYTTLKQKILGAKDRVFLSTLYVGKEEHELVATLEKALENNDNLKVHILTDALRGTREAPDNACTALLLVPLVKRFGKHRVDTRMYHTPHLAGVTKYFAPKRINETWGLQHMKLYGFDDEVLLLGANLSHDYFTDRQDRYHLIHSRKLTDYYFGLHCAVLSLSYQVLTSQTAKGGFRLSWPTSNKSCEPGVNHERFLSDSSFLLEPLLKQHTPNEFETDEARTDAEINDVHTVIYPISQLTPLLQPQNDISTEKPAVLRLLSFMDSPKIKWWFTAGYFNMLPQIQERLLSAQARGTVITAHPHANSFYKSKGILGFIPEAYMLFAKNFLHEVARRGKDQLISVLEWKNGMVNTPGGWTYHAKGLWITAPEEQEPSITVIGSSNYTKRSYLCDLESNAVIITKDENLKRQLRLEVEHLQTYASPLHLSDFEPKIQPKPKASEETPEESLEPTYDIDEDRRIGYQVQVLVKLFGGKL